MKTLLSLLVFLFILSTNINAQFITRGKLVAGGTSSDNLVKVSDPVGGNIFIGVNSNSNKSKTKSENSKGSFDYWVTKLSVNNNGTFKKVWDKTIGGDNYDQLIN